MLKTFQSTFTEEVERDLTDYIMKMESMMFGLTTNDVRCLAFRLAERNGLSNQFNKENEKAGKDWLYHFIKRTMSSP